MNLIEALTAAAILCLLAPGFGAALGPLERLRAETAALNQEASANRFIFESFAALGKSGPSGAGNRGVFREPGDFAAWQTLAASLTGVTVDVTAEGARGNKRVFRAAWTWEDKPLFVEAEFSTE